MITDPLFYLVATPAVLLMGLSKGGFAGLGLMSLPLMALVISPVQAAAIMLPILIAQDVVTVWAYRHSWDGRNLAILLPGATLGIGLGYVLASQVSDAAVALAVGVISIAFAMRRLVVERRGALAPTRPGVVLGLFWGAVCGFTRMISPAGGPPFQGRSPDASPRRWAAVPGLCPAAATRSRRLRWDRRGPVRSNQLGQGAALSGA